MGCSNFVHSSVVKDTYPSKTMECDDSVNSSVIKVVKAN